MSKFFTYFKLRDYLMVALILGLIVFEVWLDLTMPDYTAKLTTAASSSSIDVNEVWSNGGMMVLIAFGSSASAVASGFLSAIVAANVAKNLRKSLFNRILSFSDAEIDHFQTASLITRTTNDVVRVQMLVSMGTQLVLKAPVMAIWAITKISSTSVEWTTAVAVTVVSMVVVIALIVAIAFPRFRKIQKLTDDLNAVTRESISGVRVVRAFNAEDYQSNKFEKVNEAVTKNNLFTSRVMGFLFPFITVAMNGLTLAIYWIGAVLINDAPISQRPVLLGEMLAFTQIALQLVMSFMMLVAVFVLVPRTFVSVKRINEVLNTEPSISFPESFTPGEGKGEIEFDHVSFAYHGGASPCLKDISFKIEKGETFAIIGATGSGKTSLINLIPRFYDVSQGSVKLDGVDIRDYPQSEIQKRIALAPQKATLFKGDVKHNVAYGAGQIEDDDPRLKKAIDLAQAGFVYELEEGIHSNVAQGGTNFSGGQKQRLSIARSLFKDSEVVIFDDTFSALDYKTDMLVRKGIRQELSDRTVIIVAQRIGTIKNADKILVLEDGEAVGLGKHEELLKNCPVYKEIALSQLKEEEL